MTAHHLGIGQEEVAGNQGRGRVFLLPGSVGRAQKLADGFVNHVVHTNSRRMDVFLGTLERDGLSIDVGAVPTGMGCPSLGIIVTELIELGARRLLRVGTAGILQGAPLDAGSLVIATASVRDEAASDVFAPRDVPAVAHPDWVESLTAAAVRLGHGSRTFCGVVHTKDALYGREFPSGPLAEENNRYINVLRAMGVLATEMESSHLFVLAAVHGEPDLSPAGVCSRSADIIKAGTVLAIIGNDEQGFAPPEIAAAAEARAIEVALEAAVEIIRREG